MRSRPLKQWLERPARIGPANRHRAAIIEVLRAEVVSRLVRAGGRA